MVARFDKALGMDDLGSMAECAKVMEEFGRGKAITQVRRVWTSLGPIQSGVLRVRVVRSPLSWGDLFNQKARRSPPCHNHIRDTLANMFSLNHNHISLRSSSREESYLISFRPLLKLSHVFFNPAVRINSSPPAGR